MFQVTATSYDPRYRTLFDQLRRAALSVELNIVEGYALGTRGQFARHIRIAIGSAAESECLNELADHLKCLPKPQIERLATLLDEILACLHGLLRRLAR